MAKTTTETQRVAEKLHNAVDKAAEVLEPVELEAKVKSSQVKAEAAERTEQLKAATMNTQDKVVEYVHDNPIKALGIAFGAGLIGAALLRK